MAKWPLKGNQGYRLFDNQTTLVEGHLILFSFYQIKIQ